MVCAVEQVHLGPLYLLCRRLQLAGRSEGVAAPRAKQRRHANEVEVLVPSLAWVPGRMQRMQRICEECQRLRSRALRYDLRGYPASHGPAADHKPGGASLPKHVDRGAPRFLQDRSGVWPAPPVLHVGELDANDGDAVFRESRRDVLAEGVVDVGPGPRRVGEHPLDLADVGECSNDGNGPPVSEPDIDLLLALHRHLGSTGRYGTMRLGMIWIGTSGYNYPEWKGSFYPSDLPNGKMLPYYASRFSTVEINYTFYRIPSEKTLAGWFSTAPDAFRFTLKASRRITHDSQLQQCEDLLGAFDSRARTLGPKLGIMLFQLPPSFRKDVAVLRNFLHMLEPDRRAAFEFRHKSWMSDDVFDLLRSRNVALCIADGEKVDTPLVMTADHAYFRLRDEGYQPQDIDRWGDTIQECSAGLGDVFVYFKHEDKGKGPEFARLLIEKLSPS